LGEFLPYGWTQYLAGGLLLGAGMSLLFLATGLIGGMSTVFTSVWSFVSRAPYFSLPRFAGSRGWRMVYAAGLVLGALLWLVTMGESSTTSLSWWRLAAGGFVAGFGARLANGCTAGHGICGIASLQVSSIAAVVVFMATAILTANALRGIA
jgi:uncharacterized membrane protein YedE/YeeE